MDWQPVDKAPIGVEVLISLKYSDKPVVAWKCRAGYWYSDKGHINITGDASLDDDFGASDVEGWMPCPKTIWSAEMEREK